MELFVNLVGLVSLPGLIATGVFGGLLGAGMPLLLLVGLIDGPQGGRLSGWSEEGQRVRKGGHRSEEHAAAATRTTA